MARIRQLVGQQRDRYWPNAGSDKLAFAVELEGELRAETPLRRAVRLVRQELDRVESKNQLVNYLKALLQVSSSSATWLHLRTLSLTSSPRPGRRLFGGGNHSIDWFVEKLAPIDPDQCHHSPRLASHNVGQIKWIPPTATL